MSILPLRREVGETNNLRRNCNVPADRTCPQCTEPIRLQYVPGQCPSTTALDLFKVIIAAFRTDGHDHSLPKLELVGTRAPPRTTMPCSETTKDVMILCWPCWGPCTPQSLQSTTNFGFGTNSNETTTPVTGGVTRQTGSELQVEISQGYCACI